MSRKLTIALGIGVMLTVAACSSSGGGKQPAPAPPTQTSALSTSVAAPASTVAAETNSSGDVPTEGTIEFGPNWREMKKDLTEGFSEKCLLSFSCTRTDRISGATVSLSCIDVPHQTKTRWSTTA